MNKVETKILTFDNDRMTIHLPKKLTEDSKFPFKNKKDITITIKGKKLVIE